MAVLAFVEPAINEITGNLRVVPAVVSILAVGAYRRRINAFVLSAAIHKTNLCGIIVPATIVPGVVPIFAPVQPLIDKFTGDVRAIATVPPIDAARTSRRRRRGVGTVIINFAWFEAAHLVLTAMLPNSVASLVAVVQCVGLELVGVDCAWRERKVKMR